ncbi:hypothetical protein ACSSV5_000694 [Psychroflexus sp. MBR-150]|jgi:hypothetical protein
MRKSSTIKKVYSILSIFGLALLLLLSPCKVRNFIQAELGISQTKVLNKSQSTISQSNCQTFQATETIQTISKPTFQQPGFLVSEIYPCEFTINLLRHSFIYGPSRNHSVSDVPLYILYQNLKVYS